MKTLTESINEASLGQVMDAVEMFFKDQSLENILAIYADVKNLNAEEMHSELSRASVELAKRLPKVKFKKGYK